jgi:hypothetical protein
MTPDAFLYLQRSDVEHHALTRPDLGDMPRIFVDPGLLDDAIRLGLDPTHFSYRPLALDPQLHARVHQEALTRAAAIDQRLTGERIKLFGTAGPLQGWDQETMRLFLVRVLLARYLGEACDRTLREAAIGLARPSNPQLLYFDSFIATDVFASASDRFRVVETYGDAASWDPDHAAHCFDLERIAALAADGAAQAVTHVPTCYRNQAEFAAAITARFERSIDLPSPFWDIPVRRTEPLHQRIDALPAWRNVEKAHIYKEIAGGVFDQYLADLIPSRQSLHRQSDTLASRCMVQALDYQGLLDGLRGTRPHFVVADHDTGSNGPLFSVAARLGSPITVLPHSSYPASAIPHAAAVRVLERDGFRTPVRTVWGEGVPVVGVQLGAPRAPIGRERAATVCLLLNGLHGQGLSYIDLDGLARFHRDLDRLCRAQGATLIVRLKPNAPALFVAAMAFGVPAASLQATLAVPIEELAARTDLCIGYGEPTTGAIDFLYRGGLVLQVNEQRWPASYLCSPPFANDGTVPTHPGTDALAEIARLLADPACFAAHRRAQQARFGANLSGMRQTLFEKAGPYESAEEPQHA